MTAGGNPAALKVNALLSYGWQCGKHHADIHAAGLVGWLKKPGRHRNDSMRSRLCPLGKLIAGDVGLVFPIPRGCGGAYATGGSNHHRELKHQGAR